MESNDPKLKSTYYYTPEEAARTLQISTDTVYKLIHNGRLPALQVGTGKRHIWRIPHLALRAIQ